MSRSFILAANWKMNKGPAETEAFFREFLGGLAVISSKAPAGGVGEHTERQVVFFVPAIDLVTAVRSVGANPQVSIGAQNIYHEIKGAFTGETSPEVVGSVGGRWALVGHSERRSLFGETDPETSKKVKSALRCGLRPMLCVGETLTEREAEKTLEVVERQLNAGLSGLEVSDWSRVAIAYEPVWAIGTGRVATPLQASEVHTAIRQWLIKTAGASIANSISILYGGSAKPENFKEIAAQKDIDGFLVGGASLEPASFLKFLG